MGIKGLKKFLTKHNIKGIQLDLSKLAYQKIAIDTSIYMYKYKYIYQEKWLMGFIEMISNMRRNDIHPIFVFDGNVLPEKIGESTRRKEIKQKTIENATSLRNIVQSYHTSGGIVTQNMTDIFHKIQKNRSYHTTTNEKIFLPLTPQIPQIPQISPKQNPQELQELKFDIKILEDALVKIDSRNYSITKKDYTILQEVLNVLQIPFHISQYEAETDCAAMFVSKIVDLVATNDTDIFAYGVSDVIMDITNITNNTNNTNNTCIYYDLNLILSTLNLTQSQFTDFCIMCGTDYNANIPNIGIVNSLLLIRKYGSIDNLPSNMDTSILSHQSIRKLFDLTEHPLIKNPINIGYCGIPSYQEFVNILNKYNIKMNYPKLYKNYIREF
jgi:5'-3' exonuclease